MGWNVGAQQQQQVCTTLSAIFFSFYTVAHYIYLSLKKSLNDEERATASSCLNVATGLGIRRQRSLCCC